MRAINRSTSGGCRIWVKPEDLAQLIRHRAMSTHDHPFRDFSTARPDNGSRVGGDNAMPGVTATARNFCSEDFATKRCGRVQVQSFLPIPSGDRFRSQAILARMNMTLTVPGGSAAPRAAPGRSWSFHRSHLVVPWALLPARGRPDFLRILSPNKKRRNVRRINPQENVHAPCPPRALACAFAVTAAFCRRCQLKSTRSPSRSSTASVFSR